MNKLPFKSARCIAIAAFGIALPLSAAQAASQDGMDGGIWTSAPQSDASPTIYYDDHRPAAKGPQGPLRTDMIDETANSKSEPAEPARNWPENFDN
jgi:hypothetical protein